MTQVDTRVLNRILSHIDDHSHRMVRKVAFAVEALAKTKAPVDTGALRASIYTRTHDANPFPDITERADVTRVELPPAMTGEAVVGPTVDYGIDQELGTSRFAAQPYLTPAVAEVTRDLEALSGDELRRSLEGDRG